MKYTAEKKGRSKNGYAVVEIDNGFKGNATVATCYGYLFKDGNNLKDVNALKVANKIADALNLQERLSKISSRVTKKELLTLIHNS